jgi:hypothetical protein
MFSLSIFLYFEHATANRFGSDLEVIIHPKKFKIHMRMLYIIQSSLQTASFKTLMVKIAFLRETVFVWLDPREGKLWKPNSEK